MADDRNWLIDHTRIGVSDIHRSAKFYEAALRPLGIRAVMLITLDFKPTEDAGADLGGVAYGIDYPMFWIDVFHPHGVKQHTAFRATFMRRQFRRAARITVLPACGAAAILRVTMLLLSSIQTATTLKRYSESYKREWPPLS
jgi:hypothetical protein